MKTQPNQVHIKILNVKLCFFVYFGVSQAIILSCLAFQAEVWDQAFCGVQCTQASHEYLFEHLQFTGSETLTSNAKHRLNFNHPSKYLVWTPKLEKYNTRSEWLAYAFDGNWENVKDRFAKLLFVASRKLGSAVGTPGWDSTNFAELRTPRGAVRPRPPRRP